MREVDVGQVFQDASVIDGGMAICDLDVAHARFGNELLRGLVEANQRTIAVAWPRVDGQHVLGDPFLRHHLTPLRCTIGRLFSTSSGRGCGVASADGAGR